MGVFWECETCFEQHDDLRDAKRCCDNRKAALEERAAIVAWLRDDADQVVNADSPVSCADVIAEAIVECAVAIEAGEHLK